MLWLPALVPLLFALPVLAWRPQRRAVLAGTAACAMLVSFALVLLAAAHGGTSTLRWSAALVLQAELPPLATLMAAAVPAMALPVLVYAACREPAAGLARQVGLLLLFVGAMQWLVVAADLLSLIIGWEAVGACSWALIAHDWRDPANPRSALFAFVATRLGDLGLFVAALAAYAGGASFAYADLARLDATHLSLVAGGVAVAAASKSGQLPFSPWLFRAMAGPPPVSALLHAATMVAAGAYLLARLQPALASVAWFGTVLMAVGIATALSAGVVALLQPQVKKVLAASTSAHFGLMFVAVSAGFPGVAMLHLLAHGFFKSLLFLCAGVAIERSGGHDLHAMRLGRALPWIAVMAAIGAAAMAGLPPLGAAWTKDAIVSAARIAAGGWAAGVSVAGGLSAAYAVRWCWLAYGWTPQHGEEDGEENGEEAGNAEGPPPASVVATLGWLVAASVLLSALWLPAVREPLLSAWRIAVPLESNGWMAAAVAFVVLGALCGRLLAMRRPRLGHEGAAAVVADWWRLPWLIDRAVTQPTALAARAAATFDDRFIDAVPRAVGAAGLRLAHAFSIGDKHVVDRGVQLTNASVQWLARTGSHIGETLADGVAWLPSRLVDVGGHDARRLQTGFAHHAFAVLLIGALLLAGLLFTIA